VEAAREELGFKVAVLASVPNDTAPRILVPALFFKVNVVPVTVELCTASLNVATTEELTATLVSPPAGLVLTTVGGVKSEGALTVMLTVAVLLSAVPSLALNEKLSAPM
jgi:hypothetical protein